jgi:hypothetical protein
LVSTRFNCRRAVPTVGLVSNCRRGLPTVGVVSWEDSSRSCSQLLPEAELRPAGHFWVCIFLRQTLILSPPRCWDCGLATFAPLVRLSCFEKEGTLGDQMSSPSYIYIDGSPLSLNASIVDMGGGAGRVWAVSLPRIKLSYSVIVPIIQPIRAPPK